MELDFTNENTLDDTAEKILSAFKTEKIFLLEGEMGSGKTTLIKAICRKLGVNDTQMSSPTFSIANEYQGAKSKIYHFDLYRVKSQEELIQIGFEEYIDSGCYCFIEWPELAKLFLYDDYLELTLKKTDIHRRLYLRKNGE